MRKRRNKKYEGVQRVGRHTAPFFIALCAAMNVCSFHASAEETSAAAEQSIWVARYTFSGENPVTEAELADVLAAHRHTEATLTQLEAQAEEVTKYLRSKGYFVAFAYLAPQDFKDGVVDFTIVPGRYDNIVVNNTSYLHETAIRREIGIDSGELVKKSTLNRGVWLTNDLSRVETNTQIKAGSRQGTTDLVVNVKNKGHRTWGYVGVDNGGYRHTGRYQYSAFVNYASPFREGDLLSVGGVVSNGGMWSGSASYMTPIAKQGERVGISYARSHYSLGGAFTALGYTGTAETLSLHFQHNFKRSRDVNVYGTIRFDMKSLEDEAKSMSYNNPKSARNWVYGINGDSLDRFWTGGKNTFSLSYTHGDLSIDDERQRAYDAGTARTAGHFGKWNLELTRLQHVSERVSLYLSYHRQWAMKNLDSSEKFSLGGPHGVRAYPVGEASGDDGWRWTSELRWNLPSREGDENVWQLIAFADGGHVNVYHNAPAGYVGAAGRSLYGAGVGVNWSNQANWVARAHYAWKIGPEDAVSDTDRSGRFWFQIYKFF
ncbi:ShlB/FhaC/HecB family hemolysin secretion/activation protein [uncultured Selenomonas sp.]|uniref:ShlB/FhaC/HecB family hemolysin secretion/activation protein n=1 Tax=uncultured Selenomonas sp. TaxID=159275 RepID=UPI0028E37BA0|nr:ShlB/FhaC/HecB family hemolysin secretion/activation protein [uncultured Selenomonas sp.]